MKKLLYAIIALLYAATMQAQEEQKDVTKFLGIPVDGYKPAMIEKLKAKGFRSIPNTDLLEGEFNGTKVYVGVVTNNNRVYRIGLSDKNTRGETDIKARFNRLCRQFRNNPKYKTFRTEEEQTIPDNEDLSYEITVHDKRYEAVFYQISQLDTVAIYNESKQSLLSEYTQEQLDNPTEEISAAIRQIYLANKTWYDSQNILALFNKTVWFMIAKESTGEYRIMMFYDNKYNEADGEDL